MDEFVKLLINIFGEDEVQVRNPSLLEQTIPDMLSDGYCERLRAEYKQLVIRYQELCLFIRQYDQTKKEYATPLTVLQEQAVAMGNYMQVLVNRAALEGVDLT